MEECAECAPRSRRRPLPAYPSSPAHGHTSTWPFWVWGASNPALEKDRPDGGSDPDQHAHFERTNETKYVRHITTNKTVARIVTQ
jgi:hypothetical protein